MDICFDRMIRAKKSKLWKGAIWMRQCAATTPCFCGTPHFYSKIAAVLLSYCVHQSHGDIHRQQSGIHASPPQTDTVNRCTLLAFRHPAKHVNPISPVYRVLRHEVTKYKRPEVTRLSAYSKTRCPLLVISRILMLLSSWVGHASLVSSSSGI